MRAIFRRFSGNSKYIGNMHKKIVYVCGLDGDFKEKIWNNIRLIPIVMML